MMDTLRRNEKLSKIRKESSTKPRDYGISRKRNVGAKEVITSEVTPRALEAVLRMMIAFHSMPKKSVPLIVAFVDVRKVQMKRDHASHSCSKIIPLKSK